MLGELSSQIGCCPHVALAQMVEDHAELGLLCYVWVALRRCAVYVTAIVAILAAVLRTHHPHRQRVPSGWPLFTLYSLLFTFYFLLTFTVVLPRRRM
jgi:hypothetical protein